MGDFSLYIADKGGIVTGIDMDKSKIDTANQIANKYKMQAKFSSGNIHDLISDSNTKYDGILCMAVLEHIEDDAGLLKKFHSILKPGGFLLIDVPNIQRRTVDEKEDEEGHMRPGYNEEDLRKKLGKIGFKVEKILRYDPYDFIFYLNNATNKVPKNRSKDMFYIMVFPLFKNLISMSSTLIRTKGFQFTFLCSKGS